MARAVRYGMNEREANRLDQSSTITPKTLPHDFSVQPLCSLCLCGYHFAAKTHHRDTENTENAQRRSGIPTFSAGFSNHDFPKSRQEQSHLGTGADGDAHEIWQGREEATDLDCAIP